MRRLEESVEIANPQHPHCAVVLVVDTSGSMGGNKISQLNEGLRYFRDDVTIDDLARKRVDLALVSFGGHVSLTHNFSSVDVFEPPTLQASGGTPMGEAILMAIDLVESRKQEYKARGTDYYRPMIFMITDGEPTDMRPDDSQWNLVIEKVHGGERDRKFLFFAVGVDPADMDMLTRISPPTRSPIRLKPGKFAEMFQWLSRSTKRVSGSKPGEQVALENPTGPQGWGEIPTT